MEGGCFCGFVRYRVEGPTSCETNCHCTICRRTSGAPFVAWFTVPADRFALLAGAPAGFASSDHGSRTFCPRCGTPLTFRSAKEPDVIDVTTCSLDDPAAAPPRDHTRTSARLPWLPLCDGLPAFAEQRSS
jgi:hypothetical protein